MEPPVRLSISTCVGCGAMREFASCERMCRERKLELVSGGDYDELLAAAEACRVRVRGLLRLVEELAAATPRAAECMGLYESFRRRARQALREAAPPLGDEVARARAAAETQVVWRCPECGGLESPQPCIGVCIWRPTEWVRADAFDAERAQGLRDMEFEQSLRDFLARLARVTPREGEWERNWSAFQVEARRLSAGGGSRGAIVSR